MITNPSTPNFDLDQRMLHVLMQHSDTLMDMGLLNGKMGIVIFFSHYSKHTQKDIFDDIAGNLLDNVLSKIHKKLPIDFDSGLTGIGWAIEYLIQNKFMEGDSLVVCKQIDQMIMKTDPRRLNDPTLESGIEGLLHYILAHIQGSQAQSGILPFDTDYLNDVYSAVVNILDKKEINKRLRTLINKYISFYRGKELKYTMDIKPFLRKHKVSEKRLLDTPLNIKNGLSGILLNGMLN